MLEPSLHRQRHTVLSVSCRVRLSSFPELVQVGLVPQNKLLGIVVTCLFYRPYALPVARPTIKALMEYDVSDRIM